MPRLTATQAQSEARICVAPVHLKKRRLWQSAGARQQQNSRPLQPTASDRSELVLGEHRELTVASSRLGALDNYLFPVRAGRER
jgi:hypothetical protein